MLCTERSLVKHDGSCLYVKPLRCKCWSCAHCAPKRAHDLRWLARRGNPTIFLTLTIRKGLYATPALQAVALAQGWRMLRQFLCRTYDRESIPFLAVIEKHKSGWPHMHLLLRTKYIPHQAIRAWWVERFNSPQIFIEKIDSAPKAAAYVTKYLAKSPQVYEGCKRYWRSQNWEVQKDPKDEQVHPESVYWSTVSMSPSSYVRMAFYDGAAVEYDGKQWLIKNWVLEARSKWGVS